MLSAQRQATESRLQSSLQVLWPSHRPVLWTLLEPAVWDCWGLCPLPSTMPLKVTAYQRICRMGGRGALRTLE